MKESIANSQDATTMKHHVCSEKTCITCFENRGCMYEQYLSAAILNMETSHSELHTERKTERTNKKAGIYKYH